MKVYTGFKNEWDFSDVYEKALIIDPSLRSFINEVSKIRPMTPKEIEVNFNDKGKILNSLLPKIVNYAIDMYITNCGNIELGECINELYCDLYHFIYKRDKYNIRSFQAGVSNTLRRNADKEFGISENYSLNEISDKYSYCLEEYIEEKYMIDDIKKYFNKLSSDGTLSERESKVLSLLFGLDGYEKHTLLDVADLYNVSIERIRQIEMKALRKLRRSYKSKYIRDYGKLHSYNIKDEEIESIEKKREDELEYIKTMYIKSHLNLFSDSDYDAAKNIYNNIEKEYFKIDWSLIKNKEEFVKKYKLLFFGAYFNINLGVVCEDEDIEKKVAIEFLDHIPNKLSDLNLPKNTKDKFSKLFIVEDVPVKEILIMDYLGDVLDDFEELNNTDLKIFWRNIFTKVTL